MPAVTTALTLSAGTRQGGFLVPWIPSTPGASPSTCSPAGPVRRPLPNSSRRRRTCSLGPRSSRRSTSPRPPWPGSGRMPAGLGDHPASTTCGCTIHPAAAVCLQRPRPGAAVPVGGLTRRQGRLTLEGISGWGVFVLLRFRRANSAQFPVRMPSRVDGNGGGSWWRHPVSKASLSAMMPTCWPR
jgi:hypothetical protein